jgi:hypothetical protein
MKNPTQKQKIAIAAALAALHEIDPRDIETGHGRADEIVANLLRALGLEEVATAYEAVPKWYG